MFPEASYADTFVRRAMSLPQTIGLGSALARQLAQWLNASRLAFQSRWETLSLSSQFLIAASAVLLSTMTLLGAWISARIEKHAVHNAGIATAYAFKTSIEPLVQPLLLGQVLDDATRAQLGQALIATHLGRSVAAIQIWDVGGTIIYSTDPASPGGTIPQKSGFIKAMANEIAVAFSQLSEAENRIASGLKKSLLEVYAPMHERGTNRVIGVAKVSQFSETLKHDITNTRWGTIVIVGTSTLGMLTVLFTIVHRGNHTIVGQRVALERQIGDLSNLLKQNDELTRKVVTARKLTTDTNERLLRRIGADLHDGPAQLMGLALLYYDSLKPSQHPQDATISTEKFESVRGLLHDSLSEIRNISADIAPPQLDRMTPVQTIAYAIRNHEKRTGIAVECEIGTLAVDLPVSTKTCLYRFVQEGLNNSFRHASGANQLVTATASHDSLTVDVIDNGPGFDVNTTTSAMGLGLAGLADRIETCDGTLAICSAPGFGTRITAQFIVKA